MCAHMLIQMFKTTVSSVTMCQKSANSLKDMLYSDGCMLELQGFILVHG